MYQYFCLKVSILLVKRYICFVRRYPPAVEPSPVDGLDIGDLIDLVAGLVRFKPILIELLHLIGSEACHLAWHITT